MNKRKAFAAVLASAGLTSAGIGTAYAASPGPAAPTGPDRSVVLTEPSSRADGDNVESGDQTGPDSPTAARESSSGPDGDNVQSGDQTGPDSPTGPGTSDAVRSASAARAVQRRDAASVSAPATTRVAVVRPAKVAAPVAGTAEKPGTEAAAGTESATSDGPGGFADPAGSNADTQQEGEH